MPSIRTSGAIAASFSTLALAWGVPAHSGELLISIPPGMAIDTLQEWSLQTAVSVLFDFNTLRERQIHTHGVVGTLRPLEALERLLRDTPLSFEVVDAVTLRAVAIIPLQPCQPELAEQAPLPPCGRITL